MSDTRASRFLSLVLRHDPGKVGIALDESGWVGVPELLDALARHVTALSRTDLERIVGQDAKGRYDLTGDRIRANQGHSVPVDLGLTPVTPPPQLYHGTARRFVESIRQTGIHRGARHHVHLSADAETAVVVGSRRGEHVVLTVDAAAMHSAGHDFYRSANGVWLTAEVPAHYLVDAGG